MGLWSREISTDSSAGSCGSRSLAEEAEEEDEEGIERLISGSLESGAGAETEGRVVSV